jgi:PKD repeat protein
MLFLPLAHFKHKFMHKVIILLLVVLVSFGNAIAQSCATCNIDSLALSPASNYPDGALYPDPFPTITQGVAYDTSITYVMPKSYDTGIPGVGVVNVDQVKISSVSGLPSGLTWTCNVPNCTFFPQQNQYGCVRICGTSFAPPGTYAVTITVIGTALGIQQPITFDLEVDVVQGAVNTGSFTANNTSGCDSVTASFEAIIDGTPNPTTYSWSFGNGNTSTSKIPPTQTYTTPGTYPVVLETNIGNLRLTALSLTSVNENWEDAALECNDVIPIVNLPQCAANTKPDLLIRVYDGSSNLVYTTSEKTDQNPTVSWSGIAVDITNGPYTIQIYDIDLIGEDFIGTFSLTNLTVGTNNFSGNLTSGSYTFAFVPTVTYTDTVNVEVFATPAAPVLTNIEGINSFCQGDSVTLVSSTADTYQWIKDGIEIAGANDSLLVVNASGAYGVKITVGAGGCIAEADVLDTITVNANPGIPNVSYTASLNRLTTNNSGSNSRQWYYNGQPIPGATDGFYSDPVAGVYTLEFTNSAGCKSLSAPFTFTSVANLGDNTLDFNLYPNPTKGLVSLQVGTVNSPVICNVYSVVGKLVYTTTISAGNTQLNINLSDLSNGMYMVELLSGSDKGIQRLVINK